MKLKVTETKSVKSANFYCSTKKQTAEEIFKQKTKNNITVKENTKNG